MARFPPELRPLLGNRIYGCDDRQLAAPGTSLRTPCWPTSMRAGRAPFRACWAGPEPEFLRRTEGSAIRRVGCQRWQRNLAVAGGTCPARRHAPELRGRRFGDRSTGCHALRGDMCAGPCLTLNAVARMRQRRHCY